jgi:hypothetical protein
MAIEFVGGNTAGKLGATSGDTTIALNASLTGGIASAVSAGDLVIAAFSTGSAADRTLAITDGTNAYTLIGSELYVNDTEDVNLRVAYKFMGATPDAATTFGPTGNAADAGAMAVYVFRGVDPGAAISGLLISASGGDSLLANPPAITPTIAGTYIVCVGAAALEGVGTFSSSDLTDFRSQAGSDDTNDTTLGIGHKPDWTVGEFNPAAWTHGVTDNAAYSWAAMSILLPPEVPFGPPLLGNKRRAAAMAAMLATAFIAAPPQPQVAKKFNPALFEVAATPDEPPGGYSPKIVSIDDPHPPQRGARVAPLLEQPVVVADKTPHRRQVAVHAHWIPEYVSPQRLAYLTPPPVYLTPGNEDEPPGGSSPKVVSFDDPPLPQVGARVAALLYEPPPVVTDDPPFRYRRFQWGEGPAVVTEISFGSIIEPVDGPPRFRPFQDTSNWQPGPPAPIVHKKVPNAFLHLLIEDNHEPPGGSSPKIVSIDDPPLPQVSGKIAAALFVPPVVDNPPRFRPFQDVAAWYVTVPLPTLNDKLNGSLLDNEDDQGEDEDAQGGGWFVTGHLGKPRGGVVKRIIDDGETDDERRQRVFKEILGDLEQVVEEKKPVKVAQAVKAIKRIAKQAPQDTTRSDELIKALRRAEAARAEAERLEQLRIAMAIAHDIERALIAAAMLRHQNEQALIALLLAD